MELTRDTALTIARNPDENLKIETQKSTKSGKFAATLTLMRFGKSRGLLLDTDAAFETPKQAEDCLRDIVQIVRKTNKDILRGNL
jgi:hypothetical protein